MPTSTGDPLNLTKFERNYEGWGDAMDTNLDAINTAVDDLQTADATEAAARANADTTLQANIAAEATTRAAAITSEASTRSAADTSEASTRAAADTAEASARAAADALLAPLASPALTGNPTAPTQTLGDNSTKLATTAFVQGQFTSSTPPVSQHLSGVTSFNAYGDSITVGYSNPSSNPNSVASNAAWPALLSMALGIPGTNHGLSGATIGQSIITGGYMGVALQQSPSASVASFILGNSNDLFLADSGAGTASIISADEAMAVFLALPASLVVKVGAITFSGSWTSFNYFAPSGTTGKFSSTAGNTATATVNGTVVYIGVAANTSFASAVQVTIDGVSQATFSEVSGNGSGVMPFVARYAGLSSGNHTVVVTVPSGGAQVSVMWMAGNGGTAQAPLVVVGDSLPRGSISAGNLADLNTKLQTMCSTLAGDGLNVLYVAQGQYFSASASPSPFYGDAIHPNAVGQQLLAKNFLIAFKPEPTFPATTGVGGDWVAQNLANFGSPASALATLYAAFQAFLADRDLHFGWASLDVNGALVATALTRVSSYNSIATVLNGVPTEYAAPDLAGQTAAKSATTLYTPVATGRFRITAYLKVTTAATTGAATSTLGPLTITYTDGTDSVAQSVVIQMQKEDGSTATSHSGNATTSVLIGEIFIYAKTGVAIQYAIAYASDSAAQMAYEARLTCEAM